MVKDLCGRELKPGQNIILQNIQNHDFAIVSVGEPIVQQTPAGVIPVSKLRVVIDFNINVVGPSGVRAPLWIIRQPEEVPESGLVTQ